jgi:hypothetical protein
MDPDRRYSDKEVAEIFDRATEQPATGTRRLSSGGGLTLAELQEIGKEVGIESDRITRAATALDHPAPEVLPRRSFMGTPVGVGRTIYLDRRLTDQEWGQLVVDLRETFSARGRLRDEGAFRSWTNGNLQALLEPTESGERLRLGTVKSDAVPSLGIGAAMLAISPVLLVLAFLAGDAGALTLPAMVAVMGAALFGNARLRLPRWAETRELQMLGVGTRLLESLESTPQLGSGNND